MPVGFQILNMFGLSDTVTPRYVEECCNLYHRRHLELFGCLKLIQHLSGQVWYTRCICFSSSSQMARSIRSLLILCSDLFKEL